MPTSDLKSEFLCQSSYIAQSLEDSPEPPHTPGIAPTPSSPRIIHTATVQVLSLSTLSSSSALNELSDLVVAFLLKSSRTFSPNVTIAQTNHPTTSGAALAALAWNTLIPFHTVPVHHKIKFANSDGSEIMDTIQIRPEQKDKRGRTIPARFDTVLVCGKAQDAGLHGVNGKFCLY